MDDFGTLARDFGFRPQGKSAPMAASKSNKSISSFSDRGGDGMLFDDVFGGPPKHTPSTGGDSKSSSDEKPVYDDDIFHGLGGMKSSADSSAKYDDVFGSLSSRAPRHRDQHSSQFDDLLGDLDRIKAEASKMEKDLPIFDDLLSGFSGSGLSAMRRPTSEFNSSQKPSCSSTKVNYNLMEDPFVVLESISTPISSSTPVSSSGLSTNPLDDFTEFTSSGSTKVSRSPASASVFDDVDHLDGLGNSVPPASSEFKQPVKNGSPLGNGPSKEQTTNFHAEIFEKYSRKKVPVDNCKDQFGMSNTSSDCLRTAGKTTFPPYASATGNEINTHMEASPRHEDNFETTGDIWLTVSEVPLFTQPTKAPPPLRPPPPRPTWVSKSETKSAGYTNTRNKSNDFSSLHDSTWHSYNLKSSHGTTMTQVGSQIDDFENFSMGGTQNNVDEHATGRGKSDSDAAASAAAMKEAMDRAEAKFRNAKEVRERDHQKTSRSRESVDLKKDEKAMQDVQEKDLEQKQERLDCERERQEEEREQRKLEKEREQRRLEKAREIERERVKARQAVERATREARERAAAEARLKAERAAVEKAQAEARERAERAAVQRAQAEARERAAAEAKQRAEKAAAEARERTWASASRVEAETRSRADRASAERAAAGVKVNQQKNDDDLESFFNMGSSRPSTTSRPRHNSSDPLFDTEAQSKEGPDFTRTSVGASSNIRKASSSTNVVDDLTSVFGAATSSGDFHDIEGETEERRRARLERHQRTQERAAKALAEKNERDLQVLREQAERHRIAETLDVEIKRWATGKEGNLRALLSTLQYVLWPECGWQPVSLTDMITAGAVKKVYRKATLCIHPDKVQQKGANLQQKYVAEKVFDLLKEAWNKFNSEELF